MKLRFAYPHFYAKTQKTGATLSTIEPRQRIIIEDNKVKIVSNEEMLKDIEAKKKEVVAEIVSAPPGHLFLFDGHGGKEAFWLSEGIVGLEQVTSEKQPMLIDSKTFAEALVQRYEKYKGDPKKLQLLRQDKFLFASCFSKDLQQNIDAALGDVPYRPVIIAVSEHGQFGFSVREDDTMTRSVALDTAFGLGTDKPITIGDLLKLQASAHVNIAILVPSQNNERTIWLQIAAIEQKESNINKTAERS